MAEPSACVVVLGKRTVRASEIPHLQTFGKALATRNKTLVTTRTEGAPAIVTQAYEQAGGRAIYLNAKNRADFNDAPTIAFTDTKYQKHLDEHVPEWKTLGWVIIHNPKATADVATFLTDLMVEYRTPLKS
jgi:hypothetical protein